MGKGIIPALVLVFAASAVGQSSCQAANGLYLATSGGRLGDPWFVGVNGNPGVSGYLGADVAAGPAATPIGPVCLGLTPSLQLVPFALPGSGAFTLGGVLPADPALTGLTTFLQAAAADPGRPGGYAVSNGTGVAFRPPRVFFADSSSFSAYDCLTNSVAPPVPLPGGVASIQDAVAVEALGWIAVLLSDGHLVCFDANTGAETLNQQLPPTPGNPSLLAAEGATLYVLYPGLGVLFGPPVPGALRSFSLPSGAPGFTTLFPSSLPGAGMPSRFMVLPGQGIAYVLFGGTQLPVPSTGAIVPVNLVNGAQLTTITIGGSSGPALSWLRAGNVVHCLMPGIGPNFFGIPLSPGAIASIDTTTHTTLHASPVLMPTATLARLWHGPGSSGDALFVKNDALQLLQIDPTSLSITATVTFPPMNSMLSMELSPGGTEWLMVTGSIPTGGMLQVMTPSTLAVAAVATLPAPFTAFTSLIPVPSPTIRRALLFVNGALIPVTTDPATTLRSPLTLPSSASFVVVD